MYGTLMDVLNSTYLRISFPNPIHAFRTAKWIDKAYPSQGIYACMWFA